MEEKNKILCKIKKMQNLNKCSNYGIIYITMKGGISTMEKDTYCGSWKPCTYGDCASCRYLRHKSKWNHDIQPRERPLRPEDLVPAWRATAEDYWKGRVL